MPKTDLGKKGYSPKFAKELEESMAIRYNFQVHNVDFGLLIQDTRSN